MSRDSMANGEDPAVASPPPTVRGAVRPGLAAEQARLDPPATADACDELVAVVEALLLVSPHPVSAAEIAAAAEVPVAAVEDALGRLEAEEHRGWIVVRHDGRVHLASSPRFAAVVRRFLGIDRAVKLSAAALESLAIVAYRQPVTRAEVDAVRGVDSSAVLATLHGHGLVESVGRRPALGNPIEYATTALFLEHFGLRSLADLPPLDAVDERDLGALFGSIAASDAKEIADGSRRSREQVAGKELASPVGRSGDAGEAADA